MRQSIRLSRPEVIPLLTLTVCDWYPAAHVEKDMSATEGSVNENQRSELHG